MNAPLTIRKFKRPTRRELIAVSAREPPECAACVFFNGIRPVKEIVI